MMNEAQEWRTIDKSAWGPGEWQDEPDKKHWVDPATGLDCLIVRNSGGGNLCGYVGVPEGHALFGKGYNDLNLDVHGGLTFANKCRPDTRGEAFGICHTSDAEVWWLGFDCAHAWDSSPAYDARSGFYGTSGESYKDIRYVERQCEYLARQIAAGAG